MEDAEVEPRRRQQGGIQQTTVYDDCGEPDHQHLIPLASGVGAAQEYYRQQGAGKQVQGDCEESGQQGCHGGIMT
jgi:hypothetical protein